MTNHEEAYEIADRVQALIDAIAEDDPMPETQDDDPGAPAYFDGFSIHRYRVVDEGLPESVREWMTRHFGASKVHGRNDFAEWTVPTEMVDA